jgi:hypothetical protein
MYLEQLLHTTIGYIHAFFSVLWKSSANLFGPTPGTKSQIARFYFVIFIVGALAVYYLLVDSGFYLSGNGVDHPAAPGEICEPTKGLGIWAVFVLAEIASATIFGFAALGASVIHRYALQLAPGAASTSTAQLTSHIHRMLAPWFPMVLIASVFAITPQVRDVVSKCDASHPTSAWQYSMKLLWAQLWPQFLAITLIIAAIQMILSFYRKSIPSDYDRRIVAPIYLLVALGSFALALGLVGPSDLLGIVKLLRWVADPKKLVELLIG